MDTNLIIQLVCGAVGGNIAGFLLKKFNLGPIWNSVVGILGGGLGGMLLSKLGISPDNAMIGNIAGGTVGGGILMAIVGMIKSTMAGDKS